MKKNDRWFPTIDWRRDASSPEGWRRTTYEEGKVVDGEGLYGVFY
jgi:pro-apoptotic serine protease NMA111